MILVYHHIENPNVYKKHMGRRIDILYFEWKDLKGQIFELNFCETSRSSIGSYQYLSNVMSRILI